MAEANELCWAKLRHLKSFSSSVWGCQGCHAIQIVRQHSWSGLVLCTNWCTELFNRRNSLVLSLGSNLNLWMHAFVSAPTRFVSLKAVGLAGIGSHVTASKIDLNVTKCHLFLEGKYHAPSEPRGMRCTLSMWPTACARLSSQHQPQLSCTADLSFCVTCSAKRGFSAALLLCYDRTAFISCSETTSDVWNRFALSYVMLKVSQQFRTWSRKVA